MLAPRVCAPRVTRCSLGHVIWRWEAATFDDAWTVPDPGLLISGLTNRAPAKTLGASVICEQRIKKQRIIASEGLGQDATQTMQAGLWTCYVLPRNRWTTPKAQKTIDPMD